MDAARHTLWAPPTPTPARPNLGRLRGSDPLASVGLPCCDAFCLYVPSPTTPASHPEPGGCPGPGYSGLPRVRVGSALATALSGPAQGSLAFGPQICWPSFRGLLSGRLDVLQLPEDRPPVATRLNRQLPRQDSHLQERATFARRTLTSLRCCASKMPTEGAVREPHGIRASSNRSLARFRRDVTLRRGIGRLLGPRSRSLGSTARRHGHGL